LGAFTKKKVDVLFTFKIFENRVEKEERKKQSKFLKIYNGEEFISHDFTKIC
jgi:hypothetical protein